MNYSQITDSLYIGTTPRVQDYHQLHKLGITLVINMRIGYPPWPDPIDPPIRNIWLPSFDSALLPIPIRFLHKGATEALKEMDAGGIVYTHCSKGRHRGAVMGACILIAQGMPVDQAMAFIKKQRPISDPYTWYIRRRILKFAQTWVKR